MMGRKEEYQSKLEFIDLNAFVPSNHLLRQINEKIDFLFIYNNLHKTSKRDIEKILEQCLFSALALNLKRMIKVIN
nr:hypothetical protein [Fredinandcohnia onubensis]